MKKRVQLTLLLSLALGTVGLFSRLWFLSTGMDSRGLLVSGHPGQLLCWAATVLALVLPVCLLYSVRLSVHRNRQFPASYPAAAGCLILAVGIGLTALGQYGASGSLSRVCGLLGFLSAIAMVACGVCRAKGLVPSFALHGAVCVYLVAMLLRQYQLWSGEPETLRYCFQLLALVCFSLTQYHMAAASAGMGKLRPLLIFSLCTISLCCPAFPDSGCEPLLLSVPAYLSLNLISVRLPKRMPAHPNPDEGA